MQPSLSLFKFAPFSEDGGQAKLAENLHASPFNKDLSSEATFNLIHLAEQYLLRGKCLIFPPVRRLVRGRFLPSLQKNLYFFLHSWRRTGLPLSSPTHWLAYCWRRSTEKQRGAICLFYSRVLLSEILMHSLFLYKDCTD